MRIKIDIPVAGVDVGAPSKGFHAVVLRPGLLEMTTSPDPRKVVAWCCDHGARIVAVDAPCGWSDGGKSRKAERDLQLGGKKMQVFSTPTKRAARAHEKCFYEWVLNGERLYNELKSRYSIYQGGD